MSNSPPLPTIDTLGIDLLSITPFQRITTIAIPFICIAGYLVCASWRFWAPAVLCLIYLSFVTYGSTSHDLVHRTLGLPRKTNDFFLTIIELCAFRSGHAYRLAHLHHHARFPNDDDVEGAAAKMSLLRTLFEGVIFQPRIMIWATIRPHRARPWVVMETLATAALLIFCLSSIRTTPVFAAYALLMVAGSWIIPLITSYIPHNPLGIDALSQTKLFRGKVASIIALEHLYHLEHHLYPMVPHHNWPELAKRLDPYFKSAGVIPVVLGY